VVQVMMQLIQLLLLLTVVLLLVECPLMPLPVGAGQESFIA
jgi:hypothetical protein